MADVVLNQTAGTALFQGEKKLITHYNNVSDNAGGSTKIVDVSALTANKNGATPATVRAEESKNTVVLVLPSDSITIFNTTRLSFSCRTSGPVTVFAIFPP